MSSSGHFGTVDATAGSALASMTPAAGTPEEACRRWHASSGTPRCDGQWATSAADRFRLNGNGSVKSDGFGVEGYLVLASRAVVTMWAGRPGQSARLR